MKKKCIMCGREFEAGGNAKLCSVECRVKRHRECNRNCYAAKPELYHSYWKGKKREYRQAEFTCERLFAAELAYWNYLIEKYPGGAKCKS